MLLSGSMFTEGRVVQGFCESHESNSILIARVKVGEGSPEV